LSPRSYQESISNVIKGYNKIVCCLEELSTLTIDYWKRGDHVELIEGLDTPDKNLVHAKEQLLVIHHAEV
jgi:hypothetical protein